MRIACYPDEEERKEVHRNLHSPDLRTEDATARRNT